MHNNRLKAYQLQENDVLYDIFLQFFINHGASAVFNDHDFPVEPLYIGQRFDQCLCLVQILLPDHLLYLSFLFRICNLH